NIYVGTRPNASSNYSFTLLGQSADFTHDLECDPLTHVKDGYDVIWSKNAFNDTVTGFKVPIGTCGEGGATNQQVATQTIATCPTAFNKDSDGDGLLDCWEMTPAQLGTTQSGIDFDGDGVVDLDLFNLDAGAGT